MQNEYLTPKGYNFHPDTGKPIEKLPDTDRRDYAHLGAFAILALLTANSVYAGGWQLGFAVGALGMLLCALLYLHDRLRFSPLAIVSLAASVCMLVSFAIYQNTTFAVFKLLFLLLSLSVFFVSACGIKAPSLDDFRALLAPFYLFFGVSAPAVSPTVRALGAKQAAIGKKIGKVLLGLCLALPILLVLTALLIFADQAFESFIDGIDFDFGELVCTAFFGAIVLFVLFPILFAIRKNTVKLKDSEKKAYCSVLDGTLANTVLSMVALLYLVFLCTQLSYLIGGFAGLLPEDYTYAQYARRGFFEMCVICVLNLGLLFFAELLVRRDEDGELPWFTRALSVFISGFSIFLVVVALAKMFLYIRSYGLTFLRLGTSIFMFLLFFVFAALIVKVFCKNFKHMRAILAAACVILSLTALAEPYQIIAKYNVYAYQSGMHDAYELDTSYLAYNCGSYGVSALIELTEDANPDVAKRAKERLDNAHSRYYFADVDLRGASLSGTRAQKALAEYYGES
ncbi:MAG: DUF4173 domain-containing protein [Clostridia bacterium]|nr:DUF4173 domain-containing protein [Clostridia bacterium]